MQTYSGRLLVAGALGLLIWSWDRVEAQSWILTSAPQNNWVSMACSADGSNVVAVAFNGPMCISTNRGITWRIVTLQGNPWITNWLAVASSADGTRLVTGTSDQSAGAVYVSTNSGVDWAPGGAPLASWSALASSADGRKLLATARDTGRIYISSNGGASWSQTAAAANEWNSIACSADASVLVACTKGEYSPALVCTSKDSGATWQTNLPMSSTIHFAAAGCSADGATMILADAPTAFRGFPYAWPLQLSFDGGATWSQANLYDYWNCVAVSASGSRFIAGTRAFPEWYPGGELFNSSGGQTWETNSFTNMTWNAVACSADGARAFAACSNIYVRSFSVVSPQLSIFSTNRQVLISWPIPSTPFNLQQSSGLADTWTNVSATALANGFRYQITLPEDAASRFYRLRSSPGP